MPVCIEQVALVEPANCGIDRLHWYRPSRGGKGSPAGYVPNAAHTALATDTPFLAEAVGRCFT